MPKISASRINQLKNRVRAECKRRAYSGSVSSYGGTSYDYSVSASSGNIVKKEHRDKIATPLNAINSNVISDASSRRVISESDLVAMEAFTTTLEKRSITDSNYSDCRSGCTGMCFGCQGTCYNACSGCGSGCASGCTGCGSGCASSCSGCSGGCSGCGSGCAYGCSGCGSGCANTCSGDCDTSCEGSCWDTCFMECQGSCMYDCDGGSK